MGWRCVPRDGRFLAAVLALGLGAAASGWQSPAQPGPQQPAKPTFRAGVDLVTLDVSVLDKSRQPIRGLTAANFKIVEDGQPQSIDAFSAVDVPDPPESAASAWTRTVGSDVATNTLSTGRLLVLVMDDATMPYDPATVAAAKRAAHSVIDRLGPNDELAVLFTMDTRSAQDFTADHALLGAAVDKFNAGFAFAGPAPEADQNRFSQVVAGPAGRSSAPAAPSTSTKMPDPDLRNYMSAVNALSQVSEYLIGLPQRRKALIYIGIGVPVDPGAAAPVIVGLSTDVGSREMQIDLTYRLQTLIRNAQKANVNIYGIDPAGPAVLEQYLTNKLIRDGLTADVATSRAHEQTLASLDFLEVTAEETGGHATANTNDLEPAIEQIYRENGSYYLLGYRQKTPLAPGHMSHLEVTVDQPGAEVRARTRNVGEISDEARAAAAGKAAPSAVAKAVAGLLPDPAAPLTVTAAPFGLAGRSGGVVAIALTAREPAPPTRVEEHVDLLASAFSPEGQAKGSATQTATLAIRPGDRPDDQAAYSVLTRIALPAGRYQLRLASHNVERNESGSVFINVDVPDFANAALSLSGIVLDALPAIPCAPPDALADLMPFVPTTVREFVTTAQVSAFLRIYQGGKGGNAAVHVVTTVIDSRGETVFTASPTVSAVQFSTTRTADYRVELPLTRFKPGAYLLSVSATAGKAAARRDVRFAVK